MNKILTCVKEIEDCLGMSISEAEKNGFPIARFGKRVKANTDDLAKHISEIARRQKEKK